ncbi:LemA family protein [Planococcus sp. ISL-109]|uniref:LemA family protein n=1 Tax=Planococcus sp. ISL-109 TaxID=2819166 RepID=UPI001BEB6908|nr:LemA family protein [Planococcus sp. ISL-109]MBT2583698.1 LemA family protein [Planococcus sp. ISL-109]
MKKLLIPLLVLVGMIGVAIAVFSSSYNNFVQLEEDVNESYAQLESQLQRRLDLIPNLVETVKGFADQEQSVIDSVTEARATMASAGSVEEQAQADTELSGALSRLLVVVENYPEIRSSENFQQLSDELAGTENRIAVARQDYNASVTEFNREVRSFPGNMIAGIFGFDEKEYFEADAGAEDAPDVDFGTDEE